VVRSPDGLTKRLQLSEHYQSDSGKLANPCYLALMGYEQTGNWDKPPPASRPTESLEDGKLRRCRLCYGPPAGRRSGHNGRISYLAIRGAIS
jgi:hypothetical protein